MKSIRFDPSKHVTYAEFRSTVPKGALGRSGPPAGYDDDLALWSERQVALLRSRDLAALDIDHLIEELAAMTARDKRELANRLLKILMHLLKWQYQPQRRSNSWRRTLREQRRQIASLLEHSPSLRRYVEESVARRYSAAVVDAAEKTGLDVSAFPEHNPFGVDEILDLQFLPSTPA